jgi:predicted DNA-binding transcriptional regulator YafY
MQEEATPQLGTIHQAVWQDRLVRIVFQGSFNTQIEMGLEPFGLVAKMNTWYLVGRDEGYLRVLKIADILHVEILEQGFARDEGFDLATFWKNWCKAFQNRRSVYEVQIRIAPELISKLHLYLGEAIKYIIPESELTDGRGWSIVTILFDNFFQARECILNFGNAAEVLEPEALRMSVIDYARQIVDFYQTKSFVI